MRAENRKKYTIVERFNLLSADAKTIACEAAPKGIAMPSKSSHRRRRGNDPGGSTDLTVIQISGHHGKIVKTFDIRNLVPHPISHQPVGHARCPCFSAGSRRTWPSTCAGLRHPRCPPMKTARCPRSHWPRSSSRPQPRMRLAPGTLDAGTSPT